MSEPTIPSTQFERFRKELEAKGVTLRRLWETRRDGRPARVSRPCDVTCYSLYGNGFSPSIAIVIVVDYGGNNGFGTFVDSLPMDLTEMVEALATPLKGTPVRV